MDKRDKLVNEAMLKTFIEKPLFAAQLEAMGKSRRQMQVFVDEMAEITKKPILEIRYRNALIEFELRLIRSLIRH